jgi:hypothetical protein
MIKTDLEIGLENFLQIEATHFPFKKSLVFCTQISQYKGLSSHLEKNMVGGQGGDFESQHCLSNFFVALIESHSVITTMRSELIIGSLGFLHAMQR